MLKSCSNHAHAVFCVVVCLCNRNKGAQGSPIIYVSAMNMPQFVIFLIEHTADHYLFN